jgi:hypothetical protein
MKNLAGDAVAVLVVKGGGSGGGEFQPNDGDDWSTGRDLQGLGAGTDPGLGIEKDRARQECDSDGLRFEDAKIFGTLPSPENQLGDGSDSANVDGKSGGKQQCQTGERYGSADLQESESDRRGADQLDPTKTSQAQACVGHPACKEVNSDVH